MDKHDKVVVLDLYDNIISYTYIDRVNKKTYSVNGKKYRKDDLKSELFGYSIEPYDENKHKNGYKFELISMYKNDIKNLLEDLETLIEKSKEYNHYIDIDWDSYTTDLKFTVECLISDYLGKNK